MDSPEIAADLKGALFQSQLRRQRDAAKRCSGLVSAACDVIGEEPPTAAAVAAAKEARAAAWAAHQRGVEAAAARRLQAEVEESGAVHVVAAVAASTSCPPLNPRASGSADGECSTSSSAAAADGGCSGLEGFTPQWVLLESNSWRKRVQVLQRFVNAARIVIYRLRADRRLGQLKAVAERLADERQGGAAAAAAVQALLAESGQAKRPGVEPGLLAKAGFIAADAWPRYREESFVLEEYEAAGLATGSGRVPAAAAAGGEEAAAAVGSSSSFGYADFDQLEPEPFEVSFPLVSSKP